VNQQLMIRGNSVIVKAETPVEIERNGLILPNDEAPDVVGTVIACGDVTEVQLEDIVIFPASAGTVLEHEGERYLVLREEELLAVVE
jgi:co-chaperonin GroES (HSP10)